MICFAKDFLNRFLAFAVFAARALVVQRDHQELRSLATMIKRVDCFFLVAVLREIDSWHFWQDRNDQDRHDKSDKGSKGGSRRRNKKQK